MTKGHRRRALLWVLAVVAALLVAACGSSDGTTTTDSPTTTASGDTTTSGASPSSTVAPVEEATLTLVTAWPMNQTSHTGPLMVFIEKVAELSGGAMEIEVIGGPETMAPTDVHENLATGSMDLGLTSTGYYSEPIPESLVFEATLKSPAEWREQGLFDVANEWHSERINQLVIGRLGWGQAYALYSAVPITSVDDFQGKRFRGSALYVGFLQELGIEAINIAPGEIYTSLERGTVEGTAWTDVGGTQLTLQEVIEAVIMPPYYNSGIVLNINLDSWNDLSPAQQAILTDAAILAEEASPGLMDAERAAEVAIYEDAGVEVVTFEGEEAERYLAASRSGIRVEFARRGFTDEQIDELLATFE